MRRSNFGGIGGGGVSSVNGQTGAVDLSGTYVDTTTAQSAAGNKTLTGDWFFRSGRPWIDPMAFGAAWDNATDDTVNNQAALNAVPAGGGVVRAPAGRTSRVTAALVPKTGTDFIGGGAAGLSSIRQMTANTPTISFSDIAGRLRISGFNIVMSTGATSHGISLSGTSIIWIDNIETQSGDQASSATIGGNGINLANCQNVQVTDSVLGSGCLKGLYASACINVQVTATLSTENLSYGVHFQTCTEWSLVGCTVTGNNGIGIFAQSATASSLSSAASAISGCVIVGNGGAVSGNVANNSSGIRVTGSPVAITGNTITSNYGSGVFLRATSDCTVVGNEIAANGRLGSAFNNDGVRLDAQDGETTQNNIVAMNIINDRAASPTQAYGVHEVTAGSGVCSANIVTGNVLTPNLTGAVLTPSATSFYSNNVGYDAGDRVAKSLYDANTVLAANTDNTPMPITMAASTTLARLASGNIKAATVDEMRTLLGIAADLPAHWTQFVALTGARDTSIAGTAGSWAYTAEASSYLNAIGFNSTNAINDGAAFPLDLTAGTWSVDFYATKTSSSAIVTLDISFDGGTNFTTIGTADLYNASSLGSRTQYTGLVVPTSGKAILRIRALSKNASSSNYRMNLSAAIFNRTA